MSDYTPKYNTYIYTTITTVRHGTSHTDYIDWSFPFEDTEFVSGMCVNKERKSERLAEQKRRLELCEKHVGKAKIMYRHGGDCTAVKVAMRSDRPFWSPRPMILMKRIFLSDYSFEWIDWLDIPEIKIPPKENK